MATSAQYVDRTERILVSSERSAPAKVTRPAVRGRSSPMPAVGRSVVVVAISGHLSSQHRLLSLRHASVELHAGCGQLHECLLQGRMYRREFVQPDRVVIGQVTDLGGVKTADHHRPVAALA